MNLIYDTETTGKANHKIAPNHPSQPRLVQLGMQLATDSGSIVAASHMIVKPEGFTIPKEASDVHGITTEFAIAHGVPLLVALGMFNALAKLAGTRVAFNNTFDLIVLKAEYARAKRDWPTAVNGKPVRDFCAMRPMTNLCRIPSVNPQYSDFKWPTLMEAYRHAFGCEFDGAHDAMADVVATTKLFFWLKKQAAPPVTAPTLTPAQPTLL